MLDRGLLVSGVGYTAAKQIFYIKVNGTNCQRLTYSRIEYCAAGQWNCCKMVLWSPKDHEMTVYVRHDYSSVPM